MSSAPVRFVTALLAAVLLIGPALADEAKARGHLERTRELQERGGTDVARWLRELHFARGALEGVATETRAGVLVEIDAILAAGMDRHLNEARELVRAPGGLQRAELYYLKPAERSLKDYAGEAAQAKYGERIAELRREGQEAESNAAAEREREQAEAAAERDAAAAERERARAAAAAERERARAAAAAERERARAAAAAERERAQSEPLLEDPDPAPAGAEQDASQQDVAEGRQEPSGDPPSAPELSVGVIALVVLGFLAIAALTIAGGLWFGSFALRRVRGGDVGGLALVAFGGFGCLTVLVGVGVAFEDPVGGAVTVAFGLVFVGAGVLARKLFGTPEGTREVVVSRHEGQVSTVEGRPAQRVREVRVRVDADASDEEVAAAQRAWKRSLWRRREDWVAGSIEEDAVRHGGLALCGAGMWIVLSLVLATVYWFSEDGVVGLAAVGTGGMALAFVGVAVRMKLHRDRFGASRLVLSSTPLFLGERLRGLVHTGVRRELDPLDGFRLHLRCVHSYAQTSTQDRGDVRRRDVLWETEASARGRDSTETPGRLDVQVELELPADGDETSTISRDGILWELELHADLPGLDYRVSFELPVFRRDEGTWEAGPSPVE